LAEKVIPPTSILIDSFPMAVYRVVKLHCRPGGLIIDLCSGPGRWTYIIRMSREYKVVMCDRDAEARIDVLCDLRLPPFREAVTDIVLADLPYPFFKGRAYKVSLKRVEDYAELLRWVRDSSLALLRNGGKLFLKTSEFYESKEMTPGVWLVHNVMKGLLTLIDVIVLFTKPWIYPCGRFRRAIRMHNYLCIYRKGR